MNSDKRDIRILARIINYCDEIADARNRFGDSLDMLKADKHYRNSVSMCILQIGELAGHLTTEFKLGHSEMPWRAMKQMRNIAAHDYESFDIAFVWDTIISDIPALGEYCCQIIKQSL